MLEAFLVCIFQYVMMIFLVSLAFLVSSVFVVVFGIVSTELERPGARVHLFVVVCLRSFSISSFSIFIIFRNSSMLSVFRGARA